MVNDILNRAGSALGLASHGYGNLPRGLNFSPDGDGGAAGGGTGVGVADDAGGEGEGTGEGAGEGEGEGEGGEDEKPVYTKKQHDALLTETKAERKRRQELEKKVKELSDNALSPEEIKEFRNFRVEKQNAEKKKAEERGEYQKLIAAKDKAHEEALAAEKSRADANEARWRRERLGNALAREVPKHTTVPIEDVSPLLLPFLVIDEETQEIVPQLADGTVPKNAKGKDMTYQEFIESEIAKRPHFASLKPSNGSGGVPQRGKGKDGKPAFTAEQIASMSHEDFKKYEAQIAADAERAARGG